MDLLVLGGTAFLGREIARQAVARGDRVTCVARGNGACPEGASLVQRDRDRGDALATLAGRCWDAVIDVTRQPGHARRAARDLQAEHWVFISSGSVYARFDRPEQAETAELLPPLPGDGMTDTSTYGAAKVACEEAVRTARASWTIIRSGLIGGGGDWSGRSGYYPWRFAHPTGPDVLVPDDLDFPAALIDVVDLAAWTLRCATRRTQGVFNATGPTTTLGELLQTSRTVAGSSARIRPVPIDVLKAAGVGSWMGDPALPLWVDDPGWRWFATMNTAAARDAGLTTRPLADTLAAALEYERTRQGPRTTGLVDSEERRLRALLDSTGV